MILFYWLYKSHFSFSYVVLEVAKKYVRQVHMSYLRPTYRPTYVLLIVLLVLHPGLPNRVLVEGCSSLDLPSWRGPSPTPYLHVHVQRYVALAQRFVATCMCMLRVMSLQRYVALKGSLCDLLVTFLVRVVSDRACI